MSAWRKTGFKRPVTIYVNGAAVEAEEHEPLAAALLAAGYSVTRKTPRGEPRGPFCLIGMCQECVADVDGRAGVLTCLTPVKAGMLVMLDV